MTKDPVTAVADFQNQRVWAPDNDPGALKAYSSFNITPVPLPIADVLTGLQTGPDRQHWFATHWGYCPAVAHTGGLRP